MNEGLFSEADLLEARVLSSDASEILMKILYGARVARPDLLRAVCGLASDITRWTKACDKRLFRLMYYIDSTVDYVLVGKVPKSLKREDLRYKLFADADWAGDKATARSTSGVFGCIVGPGTFWPHACKCAKRTCVSQSTPEAELVAAALAMRCVGLPALDLFDFLLQRKCCLDFEEDSETATHTIKAGFSPTVRHIKRCHNISFKVVA